MESWILVGRVEARGMYLATRHLCGSFLCNARVKVLTMTLLSFPSEADFPFRISLRRRWKVKQNKKQSLPEFVGLYVHARATHSEDTRF